MVKNPRVNTGDIKDTGSDTELGRSPGGGHGNPSQYSCLENPMDRGAWWATVYRVTKSWTWLKRANMHTCILVTAKCGSEGKAKAPIPHPPVSDLIGQSRYTGVITLTVSSVFHTYSYVYSAHTDASKSRWLASIRDIHVFPTIYCDRQCCNGETQMHVFPQEHSEKRHCCISACVHSQF